MFKREQHDKYQKFKAKMDRVWTMDGLEFEEFTCDILKENGFKDVKKTQACGDYGVDVIACKNNKKYAIQCKRYKSSLGIAAIQQVYTGKDYYKADIAVVLTTSSFTRNAKNTAAKLNVQLWERTELQKLMKNALNKKEDNSVIINNITKTQIAIMMLIKIQITTSIKKSKIVNREE